MRSVTEKMSLSQLNDSPRAIIGTGFAIVLLLTIVMVFIALTQLKDINATLSHVQNQTSSKIKHTNAMREVVYLRAASMLRMLRLEDYFEKDEELIRFYSYAAEYMRSRSELTRLPQDEKEAGVHERLNALAGRTQSINDRVMYHLLEHGVDADIERDLDEAIRYRDQLLLLLEELVFLADQNAKEQLSDANRAYEQAKLYIIFLAVMALVVSVIIAVFVMFSADISTRKIAYHATHDALTDLINRREFEARLKQAVDRLLPSRANHALLYMDLDNFKVVNDTCGHAAGDDLLRQVASLMKRQIRSRDSLARLGGDEFGLILENCSIEEASMIARKVRESISEYRFVWGGHHFEIGVSIGVASINDPSRDHQEYLRNVDSACYAAKRAGKDAVHVYSEDDSEIARFSKEVAWVTRIKDALEKDQFSLVCQPIYALSDNCDAYRDTVNFEVLLRLKDKDGVTVPPVTFISAAERYELMPDLDAWVIRQTFSWMHDNPNVLDHLGMCSINISGQSLCDRNMEMLIIRLLDEYSLPCEKICFEINEASAVSNMFAAMNFIKSIRSMGCLFALDDFGNGVSSYGHLRKMPVDLIKIDGQFVRGIIDNTIDESLVRSINEIGHVMGLCTIAEFVESEEVLERLREMGVDFAQGFHLCRPRTLDELASNLESGNLLTDLFSGDSFGVS